mgnify:CR=1
MSTLTHLFSIHNKVFEHGGNRIKIVINTDGKTGGASKNAFMASTLFCLQSAFTPQQRRDAIAFQWPEPASLLERCTGKIAGSVGVKDQRHIAAKSAAAGNVGSP